MERSDSSKVIGALYVGEHVQEITAHLAKWLTECLEKGIAPSDFKNMWERYLEDEHSSTDEVPGKSMTSDEGEQYWEDHLEDLDEIPDLYSKAVRGKADRFTFFDNNSYMDIIAVRGNPQQRAISRFLQREE